MDTLRNFKIWTMSLSLTTAIIVIALSLFNGVRFYDIIIRAGVSFGVIFLLMNGFLNLFKKTALAKEGQDEESSVQERGGLIDISVGEDEDELISPQTQDLSVPGQVDKDLTIGLPDSKKQAEIVRRMGWD
jgi:hypothetical protein